MFLPKWRGTGQTAVAGTTVFCNIKGYIIEDDGKILFEESTNECFTIGEGDAIAGLEMPLRQADNFVVKCTSRFGFGSIGTPLVPPDSELEFEVDVLTHVKKGEMYLEGISTKIQQLNWRMAAGDRWLRYGWIEKASIAYAKGVSMADEWLVKPKTIEKPEEPVAVEELKTENGHAENPMHETAAAAAAATETNSNVAEEEADIRKLRLRLLDKWSVCQLKLKLYEETLTTVTLLLENEKGNVKALMRAAKASFALKKYGKARKFLEQVLTLDGNHAAAKMAHENVLKIQEKVKQRKEDVKNYYVTHPRDEYTTESYLTARFNHTVECIAALSLQLGYPTQASIPYTLKQTFQSLIAVTLQTPQYTFTQAEKYKTLLHEKEVICQKAKEDEKMWDITFLYLYGGAGNTFDFDKLVSAAYGGDCIAAACVAMIYASGSCCVHSIKPDADRCAAFAKRALTALRYQAHCGNYVAQFLFGRMCRFGIGCEINKEEGFMWYSQSAQNGYAAAQHNYAVCLPLHESGSLSKEALDWIESAAESNYAAALNQMGNCYFNGDGKIQSYEEAVKWYQRAADCKQHFGQFNMGLCYENGHGVSKNRCFARYYYILAAKSGHAQAIEKLKTLPFNVPETPEPLKLDEDEAMWMVTFGYLCGGATSPEPLENLLKAAHTKNCVAEACVSMVYFTGSACVPGVKQDMDMSLKYVKRCMPNLHLAAESGNHVAQFLLGRLHEFGIGTPVNDTEALNWYNEASKRGYAPAQSNLGNCFYYGKGIKQDVAMATKLYQAAAAKNYPSALYNMGHRYYKGEGVWKSLPDAVKCYQAAAYQGFVAAQITLGNRYYKGDGVEQDLRDACKWYLAAAYQNDAVAQNAIGNRFLAGEGVEKDAKQAVKWFQAAADQNFAAAQYNLANCYKMGEGVAVNAEKAKHYYVLASAQGHLKAKEALQLLPYYEQQNYEKDHELWCIAFRYLFGGANGTEEFDHLLALANGGYFIALACAAMVFFSGSDCVPAIEMDLIKANKLMQRAAQSLQNAAETGNFVAQFLLGRMHRFGIGCAVNKTKSFTWYQMSANLNYAPAQYNVGVYYDNHDDTAVRSASEALKYYELAASQGYAPAQNQLGIFAFNGQGMEKNATEAVKLYKIAAESNLTIALFNVAECLRSGDGIEQNLEEARKYYEQAAKQGHVRAKEILKRPPFLQRVSVTSPPPAPVGASASVPATTSATGPTASSGSPAAAGAIATSPPPPPIITVPKSATSTTSEASQPPNLLYRRPSLSMSIQNIQNTFGMLMRRPSVSETPVKRPSVTEPAPQLVTPAAPPARRLSLPRDDKSLWMIAFRCLYGGAKEAAEFEFLLAVADSGNAIAEACAAFVFHNGSACVPSIVKDTARATKLMQKAAPALQNEAESGNAVAQFLLGRMHRFGVGCIVNQTKAMTWYQMSANQHYAPAQYNLGVCYDDGVASGGKRNSAEAVKWYELAAKQGYSAAQYQLGSAYQDGEGVPQDLTAALKLFEEAAAQHNTSALYSLGICYRTEIGVEKDIEKARGYLQRAAAQGNVQAAQILQHKPFYTLNMCEVDDKLWMMTFRYLYGGAGNADQYDLLTSIALTGDCVAEACLAMLLTHGSECIPTITADPKRAVKLGLQCLPGLRAKAKSGNYVAQFLLGRMLETGTGCRMNFSRAVKWYRASADQNYAAAQSNLGNVYYFGKGVEKNLEEAVRWYQLSAAQNYPSAQYNMGNRYYKGEGVKKNFAECVKCYQAAAFHGFAAAQNALGNRYYAGEGVPKSASEAIKWYLAAAYQNHPVAQNCLGNRYYKGEGVKRDVHEAVRWYREAARAGIPAAMFNLGNCYLDGDGVEKNIDEAKNWFEKAAALGHDASIKALKEDPFSDKAKFTQDDAKWYTAFLYLYGGGETPQKFEALIADADRGDAVAQACVAMVYFSGSPCVPAIKEDAEKAKHYMDLSFDKLVHAAEKDNNYVAHFLIGRMHDYGVGCEVNEIEASKWYAKAADMGYAAAQSNLGNSYFQGKGLAKDANKAFTLFQLAAVQGYAAAEYNLGNRYYLGDGVAQNLAEAVNWYQAAAIQHFTVAQTALANRYAKGEGVKKNPAEAAKWYYAAAMQHDAIAQNALGNKYFYGEGVVKNLEEAVKWYQAAANQGLPAGQFNLGACFKEGDGVEKNLDQAQHYFELAAAQGHENAREILQQPPFTETISPMSSATIA